MKAKRILSLILSFLLVMSSVSITVFADTEADVLADIEILSDAQVDSDSEISEETQEENEAAPGEQSEPMLAETDDNENAYSSDDFAVDEAAVSDNNLYVSTDYNSDTEGYGVTKFANYNAAYTYAIANNTSATIVIEKNESISGFCFDDNHKNYSRLAVVIKDGAKMGVALSKWDMTYPVTVEAGGMLTCARPANSSVSNIHIKNKLIIGTEGSDKKAYCYLLSDEYQDCDISIRYNGSITLYNAVMEVQDLDAQGMFTATDSDITVDGAFASATFFATTLTDSSMDINGNQISGGLSDFAGGDSNQLGNVTLNGTSSIEFGEGSEVKVAATVKVNDNSSITADTMTVNKGKTINVNNTSSVSAKTLTNNGTIAAESTATVTAATVSEESTGIVKIDGQEAKFDESGNVVPVVATVNGVGYTSYADAIKAANAMTGDVTVEIYASVEFVDGMELKGNYASITFIGKNDDAKIAINQTAGGDYLEAHGKTVAFTDLTLAKANPAWSGNSGHMGNYFSVQGGTVTYTNCIFPNGACTNTGTATYNNCTFKNTSEYGLWVYDDAFVTVNGGTIDSKKGIKVYSEDELSVTSTLKVEGATFTENVTGKPAVAIGYAESVTLIGNTYNNTTGVLELDSGTDADCEGVTLVAKDAEGKDIASTLTAVDRSKSGAACGVLVDGKIYTTVENAAKDAKAGNTVTLLFSSEETVILDEGIILDKNNYTADGVTVKKLVPSGSINGGLVNMQDANRTFITIESNLTYANESVVVKVYDANNTLLATSSLVDNDRVILGKENWGGLSTFIGINCTDSWWNCVWEEGKLRADYVPAKATLFIDGVEMNTAVIQMRAAGSETEVVWADVPGVPGVPVAQIGDVKYTTLEDALAAVGAGDVVIELLDNATMDYNAREAYGTSETTSVTINGNGKTLTLNQKDSDWSSVGLANSGAKLVLNNMTIEKTGYGDTSGAWNTHAINFTCNVEMTDVVVNNSMSVENGATLNNVTINEANGYYGLWIDGNGQTVTVKGGAINATNGGRGIKIADEYVDNVKQVTLEVDGTKFNTAKKAAVLVTSTAGAKVTAKDVDIANVADDSNAFVWVDEDRAAYYNNVKVYDEATKSQESEESFLIKVWYVNGEGVKSSVRAYYNTLDDLFAAPATQVPGSNYIELRGNVEAANQVNVSYGSNRVYTFGTSVECGVTMDFKYADNWNMLPKFDLGENITLNVTYLQVIGGDIEIAGTVNTTYLYLYGTGEGVTITETGVVNANTGDATVQVKGGTVLTVSGKLNTSTLNVWTQDTNNSELIVSGANAEVNASHLHAWNGKDGVSAQKVVVENGATLTSTNFQADRGSEVTVDAATLTADTLTLGYDNNIGKLSVTNNGVVTNAITLNSENAVVEGPESLTVVLAEEIDKKYNIVFDNGVYTLKIKPIKVTYADGTEAYFLDMLEAVPYKTNYPKLEGATITLLDNVSGAGLRFMENDMVFDLNGFTYTITAGTGSQGTNTSGFQIRPEVTTDVIFKNGTINVQAGAPVVWMFNCYATDFIVENVTVDCTNMAWSYGESCYVTVSRSGDNVQLLGTTKITNFNEEVAGVAHAIGGTMTVGDGVELGGVIELDKDAQLTAREGIDVVAADGCMLEYANGVYTSVFNDYAAQIGKDKYESLAAAVEVAQENDVITLLANAEDEIVVSKQITINLNSYTANVVAGEGYKLAANDYQIVVVKDNMLATILGFSRGLKGENPDGVEKYKVHLFAGIDSLSYKNVGYEVTFRDVTKSAESKTVYESLTGENGTFTPDMFGGKYIIALDVLFPIDNASADESFTYRVYATKYNGEKVYSVWKTVNGVYNKN